MTERNWEEFASSEKEVRLAKIGVVLPMTVEQVIDQIIDTEPQDGHIEVTPYTPEFLAARAAFVAEYEAKTLEGIRLGYLEREPCYECSGEIVPTEDVEDREWVPE